MQNEAPEAGTDRVRLGLPFTRVDLLVAAGIFVAALVIYVRTLAPDLLFGDSGEFQTLAITGGLAHAYGYPVYLAIAKLFTFLPFLSLPARVSLVSAVFACSAITKVYLFGRVLNVRRIFSIIGALALMISPLFWWQSIIAEVYTISADFLIGFLLCAAIWRRTRQGCWLAFGGLMGGLCLGLHHAPLLAAPFVLAYVALSKATKADWVFAGGGALVGIAISAAAYMVMASINSPPTATNYLKPVATHFGLKSPSEFDNPFVRAKFAFMATQFKMDFQTKHFAPNVPRIGNEVVDDFGWAIPVLALAGIATLLGSRRLRPEAVLLTGPYLVLLVVPLFLDAFDLEVEFIQAHLLMVLLAVIGFHGIQRLLFRREAVSRLSAWATGIAAIALFAASAWSILGGAANAISEGKPDFLTGQRRKFPYPVDHPTAAHDLATAVISDVPDNSLLMVDWSYMDACYYVALFELGKPGIQIVAGYPTTYISPQERQALMSYYLSNARTRPIYADKAPDGMDTDFIQSPDLVGQDTGRVYVYRLTPRHLQR